MRERRKFYRVNLNIKISLSEIKKNFKEFKARIKNVAKEGLSFYSAKSFLKNTLLEIRIKSKKTKKPILIVGKVVWSKKTQDKPKKIFLTGVKIMEISRSDEKEFLQFYLDEMIDTFTHHVDDL